jgi:hypothetical protein
MDSDYREFLLVARWITWLLFGIFGTVAVGQFHGVGVSLATFAGWAALTCGACYLRVLFHDKKDQDR